MADLHFFSIGDNINDTGHFGFVPNEINPARIDDKLMDKGDILNKMGTSIPTPFARLFLFDSAFKQLNTFHNDENYKDVAYKGIYNHEGRIVPTPYHYLANECLDMIEFVYKYGAERQFEVVEWDVMHECDILRRKGTPAQRELAEALDDFFRNTSLGADGNSRIYIFKWDGIIIGGTSPVTLVYTSPNLRRHLESNGLNKFFTGENGNILFNQNKITPLYERSENFRKFMYSYRLVELMNTSIRKTNFFTYLQNSLATYDNIAIDLEHPQLIGVKEVESTAGKIMTAGVHLYCSNNEFDPAQCDYIIKPKVNHYQKEIINGAETPVNTPLVLTENGVQGFNYAAREWNRVTDRIPSIAEPFLSHRQLPGTVFTYPYITVDDMLEEKLIDVSYIIRKDKFYTGTKTNVKHLLPLKKNFFKYFRPEDIDEMISILEDKETEDVTVVLTIPVEGGTITLRKTYTEEDRIDCYDATHSFNMAVFPSYRLSEMLDGQDSNVYNIMLGTTIENLKLNFYLAENLANENAQIDNISDTVRTVDYSDKFTTRHINVRSSFDFIELCIDNYCGLIIPKFTPVRPATNKFTFCVDFGTTNTHLACVKRTIGDSNVVNKGEIDNFDIGSNDTQIMLLSDDKGFGFFLKFKTFLQREFVPMEIGRELHYPMRTTTWEVNTEAPTLKMFENVNIGFNYDKELSVNDSLPGRYKTNIKWAVRDPLARDRMKEYFKQLLWMMKSKSALNGGGITFNVVATYPQSMGSQEVSYFKNAWKEAKQQLRVNADIKFELESVAPYYSFLSDLQFGRPYMNIDIGGGTTDILHVRPQPGRNDQTAVFSAIFAANDIWGDGCNDANIPKRNGFVTFYMSSNEHSVLSDAKKQELNSVLQNASSSADVISYLFSHDNDYDAPAHFSQAIQAAPEMMKVPIVHFAGLMYYVAYVLDLAELKIPSAITFTGMGSKYIKLISDDEYALGNVISKIFAFHGKQVDNQDLINAKVTVKFAEEPKLVTAQGGLIMNSRPVSNRLMPDNCLCHGYEGEEYGDAVYYRELGSFKAKVLGEFQKFVNLFSTQTVIDAFAKLGYPLPQNMGNEMCDIAESSFDLMMAQKIAGEKDQFPIEEPMFFWTLKETIYQIGKSSADKIIKRKRG